VTLVIALIPFLLDGWGNTLHLWSSPPTIRALSGLAAGIVMPLFLMPRVSLSATGLGATTIGASLLLVLSHPGSAASFEAVALAAAAGFVLLTAHLVWRAVANGRERSTPEAA